MTVERILLVEDDPDAAELTQLQLKAIANDVTIAPTCAQARALASSGDFDCILLDLDLPDSRGLETVQAVLTDTDTPIVVLSSHTDESVARNAVRLGAHDYLMKHSADTKALDRAVTFAVERARGWSRERFLGRPDVSATSGLFSRSGWETILHKEEQRCVRYGTNAAVFIIGINADMRPAESPELLRHQAATEIALAIRSCDVVCTLGEDMFGVLAVGCDPAEVNTVADRLYLHLRDHDIPVSVGIGMRADNMSLRGAAAQAERDMLAERRRHHELLDDEWSLTEIPLT